ncbi:MAG: type II 3-dehydroquinate dehydratase [Bacteroidales bacterium]|jgi:3-dehydroquinate dehydratase-2|nr:type II 3-dehydroquinate dehydratase [Bacteroidales bacterium]
MKIVIINGPNLNMLGIREPEKYGSKGFTEYLGKLEVIFPGCEITSFQSNIEGEIVDQIQSAGSSADAIIINPAGYTHTSVAIADAIALVRIPVVEVHITNLLGREEFRHVSLTGRFCRGSIMGFGLDGYRLAIEAVMGILKV